MSEQKHTPGPWYMRTLGAGYYKINARENLPNSAIAILQDHGRGDRLSAEEYCANAERIVACVNACEGISTETLEQYGPAEIKSLLATATGKAMAYDVASAQRDELRAVLKEVAEWIAEREPDNHLVARGYMVNKMRVTLARVQP